MEISKPYITCPLLALFLATTAFISTLSVVRAGDFAVGASSEADRRAVAAADARQLLTQGDEAYQAGKYQKAVETYERALTMLPDAPLTRELREATKERYAQAAVVRSKELSRRGDVAGAEALIDKVLSDGVAPTDLLAKQQQAELADPIRTNPALDAEHATKVDRVRKLLYTAEGAYNLGKFDEASATYEQVLRLDPYNTAARRGMERISTAKQHSADAAYDHARAELLAEVDSQMEMKVTPSAVAPGLGPDGYGSHDGFQTTSAKLKQIILPRVALEDVSVYEAADFIRAAAAQADTTEPDPARKGVNILVNLGPKGSETERTIGALRFDLRLNNVPLATAIEYITNLSQTTYILDEYAAIITPRGASAAEDTMFSRTYRVPPDFLTNLSSVSGGSSSDQAETNPFGDENAKSGLLTTRLSPREALEKNGINFPEGSSVTFSANTNTLIVTHTPAAHEQINALVQAIAQTEPTIVTIKVTAIRTSQENLEELGYDWLVNPYTLNSDNTVYGSGGTAGNSTGRSGADFDGSLLTGVPTSSDTQVSNGLVTGGLRSGDTAYSSDSITELTNNVDRAVQTASVAPGILGLTGIFSDGEVQMLMRGLNQRKGTDTLICPSVTTRSSQASSIFVGREFIYPTEYEPPELPTNVGYDPSINLDFGYDPESLAVTPAMPTAFETRNTGVTLEVLPVVDASHTHVELTLNPDFIEFDGFINYGSPITFSRTGIPVTENRILMPVFSRQHVNTQLSIQDGATIAFGGLLMDKVEDVEDKVPVIGDLPLVGRLFRSDGVQRTTTAVIFFVHVEIQDPTGRKFHHR